MAVWTLSPSLADPTVSSNLRRSLASLLGIILCPHFHKRTGIFSQMRSAFCFSFYFFGVISTVPLLATRPHPVFLLEVSAVTNRRVAGVYSASAPGVMGAMEPRPLGRTVGSSRRLSPATSAPHHSLMRKTGLTALQ